MVNYLWAAYQRSVSDLWAGADQSNGINGFMRVLQARNSQRVKAMVNCLDATERNGKITDYWVDVGPHAWIGMGMLHLDVPRNFEFARQLGEFILTLQDDDGGVIAGPEQISRKTDKAE